MGIRPMESKLVADNLVASAPAFSPVSPPSSQPIIQPMESKLVIDKAAASGPMFSSMSPPSLQTGPQLPLNMSQGQQQAGVVGPAPVFSSMSSGQSQTVSRPNPVVEGMPLSGQMSAGEDVKAIVQPPALVTESTTPTEH